MAVDSKDFLTGHCGLSPRQAEVVSLCSQHPYVLYGGIAGTGKTRVLVAVAAFFNLLYASYGHKIIGALATKDDRRFKERFMKEVNDLLVEPGLGYVTAGTKDNPPAFIFTGNYAHCGQIQFISLHDTNNLRGRNLSYICIDELSDILEEEWHDITWRIRELKPDGPFEHCPILCAANAEGVGAQWVYEYFVKQTFNTPKGENVKQFKDLFYFHPSKLEDNPNKAYVEYNKKILESQPEHLRRARLEGIWDSKQGARFPYELQVINPIEIPRHWPRIVGLDHGYGDDPAFGVWAAFDQEGNCYVYHEYEAKGKDIISFAKDIRIHSGTAPIKSYYADPTMFRKNPVTLEGLDTYFRKEGIYIQPSTNKHELTNALIEQYMGNNQYAQLYIFPECKRLIQSLEAARFGVKTNNPENLEPHSCTHAVYSLGYLLGGHIQKAPEIREPDTIQPELATQIRKFEKEWARRNSPSRKRIRLL